MTKLDATFVGMTLSEGTLRPQDLVEKALFFIRTWCVDIPKVARHLDAWETWYDTYSADEVSMGTLWDAITNAFDNIAPEGTYFGTLVGDGACFGFWSYDDPEVPDWYEELPEQEPESDEELHVVDAHYGIAHGMTPPDYIPEHRNAGIVVYSTTLGLVQG